MPDVTQLLSVIESGDPRAAYGGSALGLCSGLAEAHDSPIPFRPEEHGLKDQNFYSSRGDEAIHPRKVGRSVWSLSRLVSTATTAPSIS
ncbi:MAG: hypothetical protein EXS36_07335 [Pedosphaera sp.]|nr:hypothetical protein [Pedosphaera sp.]